MTKNNADGQYTLRDMPQVFNILSSPRKKIYIKYGNLGSLNHYALPVIVRVIKRKKIQDIRHATI